MLVTITISFLKIRFYFKGKIRMRDRGKRCLPATGSLPELCGTSGMDVLWVPPVCAGTRGVESSSSAFPGLEQEAGSNRSSRLDGSLLHLTPSVV